MTTFDLMKTSAKEFAVKNHGHFIGGEWCSSKKTFEVFDPSSGKAFTKASLAEKSEVDAAVSAARIAFERGEWSHMQSAERAKIMWRIADLIEELMRAAEDLDLVARAAEPLLHAGRTIGVVLQQIDQRQTFLRWM